MQTFFEYVDLNNYLQIHQIFTLNINRNYAF